MSNSNRNARVLGVAATGVAQAFLAGSWMRTEAKEAAIAGQAAATAAVTAAAPAAAARAIPTAKAPP